MGALVFLKDSLWAEEHASRCGFLQARDARLKMLSIFIMLLAVLFSKSIFSISFLYVGCLILTGVSSINIGFFLKRTWFFIPLFSLGIAVPALFDVFSPGDAWITFQAFGWNFVVTKQGIASAAIFFLRVLTSVSLGVLLVLTTRHSVLLKALRVFGIPQIFIMILEMCYRYVYLFIEMIQNTYFAIQSRVGHVSSVRKGQGIVAWNIASLWQRSYVMHSQVYSAMLSRGYAGEPRVLEALRIGFKDILFFVAALLILGLCLWQNLYLN